MRPYARRFVLFCSRLFCKIWSFCLHSVVYYAGRKMEKGLFLQKNNWSFQEIGYTLFRGRDLLHFQNILCKRFTRVSLAVNTNFAKIFACYQI